MDLLREHWDVFATLGVLCAAAFVWQFVFGPKGLRARKIKEQVRELEVQIRLGKGVEIAIYQHAIAQVYLKAGDLYNADTYLARAIKTIERESGAQSPELLPLLNEQLKLMERMKRKKEAKKMKERIASFARSRG